MVPRVAKPSAAQETSTTPSHKSFDLTRQITRPEVEASGTFGEAAIFCFLVQARILLSMQLLHSPKPVRESRLVLLPLQQILLSDTVAPWSPWYLHHLPKETSSAFAPIRLALQPHNLP